MKYHWTCGAELQEVHMRMFIAKLVNKSSTIKHFAAYRSSKGSINKYQIYCRSAKLWIGLQSTWNLLKSAFEIRVRQSIWVGVFSWGALAAAALASEDLWWQPRSRKLLPEPSKQRCSMNITCVDLKSYINPRGFWVCFLFFKLNLYHFLPETPWKQFCS